jgi:hypothetical protein
MPRRRHRPAGVRYRQYPLGGSSIAGAAQAMLLEDSHGYGTVVRETSYPARASDVTVAPTAASPSPSPDEQRPLLTGMATERGNGYDCADGPASRDANGPPARIPA